MLTYVEVLSLSFLNLRDGYGAITITAPPYEPHHHPLWYTTITITTIHHSSVGHRLPPPPLQFCFGGIIILFCFSLHIKHKKKSLLLSFFPLLFSTITFDNIFKVLNRYSFPNKSLIFSSFILLLCLSGGSSPFSPSTFLSKVGSGGTY